MARQTTRGLRQKSQAWLGLSSAALLALPWCGACTTIYLNDGSGVTKVERRFGFSTISVDPSKGPLYARVESVGFNRSPTGYSIGYDKEALVVGDPGCGVFFWISDGRQLQYIHEQFGTLAAVCASALSLGESK